MQERHAFTLFCRSEASAACSTTDIRLGSINITSILMVISLAVQASSSSLLQRRAHTRSCSLALTCLAVAAGTSIGQKDDFYATYTAKQAIDAEKIRFASIRVQPTRRLALP
jgi:hypothetical protein